MLRVRAGGCTCGLHWQLHSLVQCLQRHSVELDGSIPATGHVCLVCLLEGILQVQGKREGSTRNAATRVLLVLYIACGSALHVQLTGMLVCGYRSSWQRCEALGLGVARLQCAQRTLARSWYPRSFSCGLACARSFLPDHPIQPSILLPVGRDGRS